MAGRILIVDGTATNRILMKARLASACYDTILAAAPDEALALAVETAPDLVLADAGLGGDGAAGLCRAFRNDARLRDLPVVVLADAAATARRLDAFAAGADAVLAKPVEDVVLLARLRSLLRLREAGGARARPMAGADGAAGGLAEPAVPFQLPPRLAIVAEDAGRAEALRDSLRAHLPSQIIVATRSAALSGFGGASPDVIAVCATGDGVPQALAMLSELGVRASTRDAAVVLVAPAAAGSSAALALDMGASDLIPADCAPAEIALRLGRAAARKREEDHWRRSLARELRLAATDPLTGLYNRRHALPRLAGICDDAAAGGDDFAVLLLDIDRFKSVNDSFGHAAGDRVLCEIADRLRGAMRPGDLLARIGGEEFLVVMPGCDRAGARLAGERLRRLVADEPVHLGRGLAPLAVTLSVGIAVGDRVANAAETLDRADRALLACKSSGRNRVREFKPAA